MFDYEKYYLNQWEKFKNGDQTVILDVWEKIKFATIFFRVSDFNRCLERSDFNQLGLIGVYNSFKSFDDSKGLKLTNWIIKICNQNMISGFKYSSVEIPFTNLLNTEYDINQIMSGISTSFEQSFIDEEYFQKLILIVSNILYNKNRMLYEVFKFRLENPDSDSSETMNKLGISTVYYKYLKEIKTVVDEVVNVL